MGANSNNGSVYIKSENGVGSIVFGHPLSNSLPSELLHRIANGFNELDKKSDVNVILLKSEGETAFCAGAALDELVAIENKEDGKNFFMGFANVINAMRCCSKLIVGRVHGKTVGGGVGLIAACDYVFATENASVKLSELSIGIGPFVIEPAVTRKIGTAAMAQLSIDATHWQNAYWAKDKGLYNRVFEKTTELDKNLNELLEKLANYNLEANNALKKTLWINTENWGKLLPERAEISGKLVLSASTKKSLQKFKKQ